MKNVESLLAEEFIISLSIGIKKENEIVKRYIDYLEHISKMKKANIPINKNKLYLVMRLYREHRKEYDKSR